MSTYHNLCSPALVSASDSKGNVEPRPKVRNLISLRAGEVRRALWSKSPRSPLTEWSEKLSSKSIQTKHLLKRIQTKHLRKSIQTKHLIWPMPRGRVYGFCCQSSQELQLLSPATIYDEAII